MNTNSQHIIIIGAGLSGLMIALMLEQLGYPIDLYEKADEESFIQYSPTKAIDLDLSLRALTALDKVHLLPEIKAKSISTIGRHLFFENNISLKLLHHPKQQPILNISRYDLHAILKTATKDKNIKIHYQHELVGIENKTAVFKVNHMQHKQQFDYIIGCDGIHSVFHQLFKNELTISKQYFYAYKELSFPDEFFKNLSPDWMYKWISKQASLLSHPRINHSFSGTLLLPNEEDHSRIFQSFIASFQNFTNIKHELMEEFQNKPLNRLGMLSVEQKPSQYFILLGDAAHGMLPFLGQGINCAFEDCDIFTGLLVKNQLQWDKTITEFLQTRHHDTNSIIKMSAKEYKEFDYNYESHKQVFFEKTRILLQSHYPQQFQTYRYLLAFTHTPYNEVMQKCLEQNALLNKIYDNFADVNKIAWPVVTRWINHE